MSNAWGGSSATLGYRGTRANQPPNYTFASRSPLVSDTKGVEIGDFWINKESEEIYVLLSLATDPANPQAGQQATWSQFAVGGGGDVATITGNQGDAVVPDGVGNINILGDVGTIISSQDDANTLRLTVGGLVPISFETDDTATVVASDSVLRVEGGSNINTTGATNVVTIHLDDTVTISGSLVAGTGIRAATDDITATTGNIIATAGNVNIIAGVLNLPNGAAASTSSIINVNGSRFLTVTDQSANIGSLYFGTDAGNPGIASTVTSYSTAMGTQALANFTSGGRQSAFGYQALTSFTSAGALTNGDNCAFGYQALGSLLTGKKNICIGTTSGTPYTGAESNNILISSSAVTGVTGENNVMRLGDGQTQTFIAGIAGVTTTVNDAIPVLISASTNQLGTVSSSARYKDNIRPMDIFSDCILKLKPSLFNFKSDTTKSQSWGLIAEEVADVFPELVVFKDGLPETVKYHELTTLLLNEIQMLRADVNILSNRLGV